MKIYTSVMLLIFTLTLFFSSNTYANQHVNSKIKPNVVYFLVDDLGWSDIENNGSKSYQTPNINKLANEGMSFKDAYATHPLCIGSRFSLMTGKYPARIKKSKRFGTMQPKETTLAEAFKQSGYQTFFAGKWHLGKPGAFPQDQGFDINVGGHDKGAPASYFYPYGKENNSKKVPGLDHIDNSGDYLTDSLTEKALSFIETNKEKPFLLYLSHYAVHVPLEAKKAYKLDAQKHIDSLKFTGPSFKKINKAKEKMHQDNATYAGMIKSIDDSLGAIIAKLEALNLSNDTIIVFTSDNGGESTKTTAYGGKATSNQPLKAGKCWLYEGGIRVPLIVKWPNKIPANTHSKTLVTGTDHYPTLLQLASINLIPEQHLDGYSYKSALLQQSFEQRQPMFWHFPTQGHLARVCGTPSGTAIRDGDYKLINWYNNDSYELYNLKNDIGESKDISKIESDKAKLLLGQLNKWQNKMGINTKSKRKL